MIKFCVNNARTTKTVIGMLYFVFTFNNGWAQLQSENSGKWVFGLGFTFNQSSVIDKSFSSLAYSGNGLGINSLISYKEKYFEQELGFGYSTNLSTNAYKNNLNETYLYLNYSGLFGLSNPAKTEFKILTGPSLSFIYDARKYEGFVNNNNTFEFASSLGATIEARIGINKLFKGFSINNRLTMPFVSFVEQPAYGMEGFFFNSNNQGAAVKNENGIVGPQKFFRISNTLSMHKKLAQHHKIILAYTADFYNIKTVREVKRNNNSLSLLYCYTL